MQHSNKELLWRQGTLPMAIIFFMLGAIGILARILLGIEYQKSLGEIVYWIWPVYFIVSGGVLGAVSLFAFKARARIGNIQFKSISEIISWLLVCILGLGFILSLITVLIGKAMHLPNHSTISQIASIIGVANSIVAGGISAPVFVGLLLFRINFSSTLILIINLIGFVIGVLIAFIFYRYGLLTGFPIFLSMFTGALLATPIGIFMERFLSKNWSL